VEVVGASKEVAILKSNNKKAVELIKAYRDREKKLHRDMESRDLLLSELIITNQELRLENEALRAELLIVSGGSKVCGE